jgi:hypothetical protein
LHHRLTSFELLAHRAVFDCSLRSLRIAPESRLLRRRSPTEKRVGSLLLSTAARDPRLIARSARCDVRANIENPPLDFPTLAAVHAW